jgi:hypothetical protein
LGLRVVIAVQAKVSQGSVAFSGACNSFNDDRRFNVGREGWRRGRRKGWYRIEAGGVKMMLLLGLRQVQYSSS